ncbi:hypothetical protein ACX9R5_17875 [Rathayibacter sp. CAU 1779]
MTDLDEVRLGRFWGDVQRTGQAIESVVAPRKIDYLVTGPPDALSALQPPPATRRR